MAVGPSPLLLSPISRLASATSLNLRQGGASSPVTVSITPQNGFSSTVQVSFTGLPNGVTTSPVPPFSISMGAASYGNSRRYRHSRCAQRARCGSACICLKLWRC